MGVTYYRVVKERKNLRIKLDFYEIRINASEDRWRLIFMKNQEQFEQIARHIVDKYDKAYYIEYKDDLVYVDYKRVHDTKLQEFFKMLNEAQIDFTGPSSRKTMYITYRKEKKIDVYELSFRVYTNRSVREAGYAAIKYQSPNYAKTKLGKEGYSSYEYYLYVLKPNWTAVANKSYPKPEYIRIGDWL